VVGIVTVLIAILLPVLSRVRAHAQAVKCQANLRSIGQALTMYTGQYRYYPGLWIARPDFTKCAAWPVRLRALMGGNQNVFYCPAQDERCRWADGSPGPNVRATALEARNGYDVGERLLMDLGSFFSYGYNAAGSDGTLEKGLGWFASPNITTSPHTHELRASRLKQPADMIAIADATADGFEDFVIRSERDSSNSIAEYWRSWPGKIHGVHQGGSNVLFCDGHVQWYPQDYLTIDWGVGYDPAQTPRRQMWNYDHER